MGDNCRIGFGFNVKEIWEIKLTERYYDETGGETSDIKQEAIPCIARKKLISTWPTYGDSEDESIFDWSREMGDNDKTDDYSYPTG